MILVIIKKKYTIQFNPGTCEANISTLNVKGFGVVQLVLDLFKPKYKPAMKEILENKVKFI